MHRPVRTCVGCREQAEKADLLRIVWSDGGPLVDPRQTAPGRGAYLHRRASCLALAGKRRAVGRALRLTGQMVDPDVLTAVVGPHLEPTPEPAR